MDITGGYIRPIKEIAYTLAASESCLLTCRPGSATLARYAATGAGDVIAMQGEPGARMRVGEFRIIFVKTDDAIEVRAVGSRRDIYR